MCMHIIYVCVCVHIHSIRKCLMSSFPTPPSLLFLTVYSPARPGASDDSGEVFDRINPQKLAGALENAKTLGTMEVCLSLHSNIAFNSLVVYVQQEGVPSNMLPLQAQQREKSQEPEKLVSLEQPETSLSLLPFIPTQCIHLHQSNLPTCNTLHLSSLLSSPSPPSPPASSW